MSQKNTAPLYLTIAIGLILIIAFIVFLASSSDYNGQSISGAEVLRREPTSFWVFVVLGFISSMGCFYAAYAIHEGVGFGKNINVADWVPVGIVAVAFILLLAPWGKAFTDKADGGATLPKIEQR